jgi:hypothetical protein
VEEYCDKELFEKFDALVWTGFIRFRTGTSGGLQ